MRSPVLRIEQLIETYASPEAAAAELLCDRHDPEKRAYRVISSDLTVRDVSYGELRASSEKFASALASLGVGPGDRVATLIGKSREYLVTLLGIWRLGAVHVPLFTAFAPPAIVLRLKGSNAKVVVCDAAQYPKLQPGIDIPVSAPWSIITTGTAGENALNFHDLIDAAPEGFSPARLGGNAPLIHIYTSGTTGNPKGVVVPIRALAAFHAYAEFGFDLGETDVFWCAADPGWAYGLYFGILATFLTGTPSILLEGGFSPETTLAVLSREGVSNYAAAPTVYRALRTAGLAIGDLRLRCLSSAGEPLTPEVNEWAVEALGVSVHDHYGQTEAGMLINNHHHSDVAKPIKGGSMGRSMPGWRAVILEDDRDLEVASGVAGRVAMDLHNSPLAWFGGYDGDEAKSAEKFTENGRYYLTGDTGLVDEDGYFYFSARDDDVIIMAGYRIGPFEVESTISTHPAVAENAIIAVPDPVKGEVIEAYVVLREGHEASPDLAREIQLWVKARFAAHAFPRVIHFEEQLPKTPSGKIQRFVLKNRRLAELSADA